MTSIDFAPRPFGSEIVLDLQEATSACDATTVDAGSEWLLERPLCTPSLLHMEHIPSTFAYPQGWSAGASFSSHPDPALACPRSRAASAKLLVEDQLGWHQSSAHVDRYHRCASHRPVDRPHLCDTHRERGTRRPCRGRASTMSKSTDFTVILLEYS